MSELTYTQFQVEFFRLHNGQDYAGALNWLDRYAGQFPEQVNTTAQWRICAQTMGGQPEAALVTFKKALDNGIWWPADVMQTDPDLASLQADPTFQTLVERCAAIHAAARQGIRPELYIFEPADLQGQSLPLLLTFHGRMGNAGDFSKNWKPLVQAGWLVACAQSSQLAWPNAYTWDDWDLARSEAHQHYERLCGEYQLDSDRLILGGFSQGGGLVAWLALGGDLPARGFVAVAPYVPDFEALGAHLKKQFNPAGGYLVTGEDDQGQDIFDRLEALLAEQDLPVQREKIPGVAHAFPPDFPRTLERAVAFLEGSTQQVRGI